MKHDKIIVEKYKCVLQITCAFSPSVRLQKVLFLRSLDYSMPLKLNINNLDTNIIKAIKVKILLYMVICIIDHIIAVFTLNCVVYKYFME